MCTPTVDGGASDDLSPCTTGETCTVGVCGGGAPVTPCFDITGPWSLHSAVPGLGVASHTMISISQRGSDVLIGGYVGHIDPPTGALNVRAANPYLFCGPFDVLLGSVAPDGLTFSMSGFVTEPQPSAPDHCDFFSQTLLGDHCGNGMFEGVHLSDRPHPLPAVPLPLPLRVQLQGAGGLCLETRHDSTSVLQNELGVFKAKSAP